MVIALARPDPEPSQSDVPCRFLTQKELDPDSIAFNSQNARYHFPRRFYISARALFGASDPLVRVSRRPTVETLPIGVYQYVNGNPIRLVDPFGLQQKSAPVNGGTIKWEFKPHREGREVRPGFEAFFTPDGTICCENISFIQVVLKHERGGKRSFPTDGGERHFGPFIDPVGQGRVDFYEGETDPYYGAQKSKSGKWEGEGKSTNERGQIEGTGLIGSAPGGRKSAVEASIYDAPYMQGGLKDTLMMFEVCAVCIDNGQVFGCVTWGVENGQARPGDTTKTPSKEWEGAVKQYDAEAKKRGWTTTNRK